MSRHSILPTHLPNIKAMLLEVADLVCDFEKHSIAVGKMVERRSDSNRVMLIRLPRKTLNYNDLSTAVINKTTGNQRDRKWFVVLWTDSDCLPWLNCSRHISCNAPVSAWLLNAPSKFQTVKQFWSNVWPTSYGRRWPNIRPVPRFIHWSTWVFVCIAKAEGCHVSLEK